MLFMLSWPALGFFVATPLGSSMSKKTLLGIFAGVCAVTSMVVALPLERKHLVTDGSGHVSFHNCLDIGDSSQQQSLMIKKIIYQTTIF